MNPEGSLCNSHSCTPTSDPELYRHTAETLRPDESSNVKKSSYVFYSHKKDGKEFSNLENNPAFDSFGEIVLCSDFDDLLNLLEVDAVEGIVFDQSVGLQEVNYLTRWARIFKPALKCLQYQISRRSPNAAFFSSTQI